MRPLVRVSVFALALAFSAGQLSAGTWPGYPAGPEPPPSALARTDDRWASGVFAPPGADRPCDVAGVYNGELIVGGAFRHIGGVDSDGISRWDGTTWRPLAEGLHVQSGDRGEALALVEYGGELIVGGYFVQAGHISASRVAAWDGRHWRSLGAGLNGTVKSLIVWNGDLIAGGEFTASGGVSMPGVARWDGAQWHAMSTGTVPVDVRSLAVFGGELIAAGGFDEIGGQLIRKIARWDGVTWRTLGSELGEQGGCYAVAVREGELLVGGWFDIIGGAQDVKAAVWDGSEWYPFGEGINGRVLCITTYGDRVVVGGAFGNLTPLAGIAAWSGTGWETIGGGVGQYQIVTLVEVHSLTTYNGDLIAAGEFGYAGGRFAMYVARWDESRWHPMCGGWGLCGGGPTDTPGRAAGVYDNRLIVGGRFSFVGCDSVGNVAAWDGSDWSALGAGFSDLGTGAAVFGTYDGDLIAGGDFERAGDEVVNHIARWDGSTWRALGSGVAGVDGVYALAEYDGKLIVGGAFDTAGGFASNGLAAWSGAEWLPIGAGLDASTWVFAVLVHDGKVVLGGHFGYETGFPGRYIAVWDGESFAPLDGGVGGTVHALAEFQGDLIAGGYFQEAGGVTCYGVARWTGAEWAPLGLGTSYTVLDLAIYQGTLVAGGAFTWAGSVYSRGVARWNGVDWSAFGTGVIDPASVSVVTVYNGDLFVLGNFRYTGQEAWNSSYFIARWSDIPTPVDLLSFTAMRIGRDVVLQWREGERRATGYHVHRAVADAPRVQLTSFALAGPNGQYEYVDRMAPPGTISYWLHALDGTDAGEWHGPVVLRAVAPSGVPRPLDVYPNPSGAQSTVSYELEHDARVRVQIFDAQGRRVTELFNGPQPAGSQAVFWDGRDAAGRVAAAGTYYVRLEIDGRETTTRLSLVR